MIGFIGIGNMGGALINGAVGTFGSDNVTFFDTDEKKVQRLSKELHIIPSESNAELAEKCDIIVLAVKPQVFQNVINSIKNHVQLDATVVSIAPGISTDYLSEAFDSNVNVVRVMPNTPAMIGEGMAAICFAKDFVGNKEEIFEIFNSVGRAVELPEKLMDAAVVANGSSPAFVYMFIEAMADSAVKYGIPRDLAYEMVAQTVVGSAKMVLETKIHPGALKDAVCSPGGTTICGVEALEENNFRGSIMKGCEAVFKKTEMMKK